MGPPQVSPRLGRVVARFVRAFAPERILLFGSHAKGTQHPGSDLDLLVIVADDAEPTRRARRARQLAADCFPPVDVVFATPSEVAGAASAASPFLASILETAVVVYERGSTPTFWSS